LGIEENYQTISEDGKRRGICWGDGTLHPKHPSQGISLIIAFLLRALKRDL